MKHHEWLLKRNCSLSPRQLAFGYVVLCILSFAVAMIFASRGAWLILVFSALEMVLVAIAFLYYARHATDREHIALTDDCLLIEIEEAGETRCTRLDRHWARVSVPVQPQDLIRVRARNVEVQVGRFATSAERQQLAHDLQQELQSHNGSLAPSALMLT